MSAAYIPGIDTLTSTHADWVRDRRVGLVGHRASVDARGRTSLARLQAAGARVTALLGPEHGFSGRALAGEKIATTTDTRAGLPVFSLYGEHRKPTAAMMAAADVFVFDLQDLGFRFYTYVSTLRLLMEAASEHGKTVIVADRPIPLPRTVDGPMLTPDCTGFVGLIPAPACYAMTPGETARWINASLPHPVELRVATMRGWRRAEQWPTRAWTPPSPSIRSFTTALCYPATVFFEAFPFIDHARALAEAFQQFGAPWTHGAELADALNAWRLPGVRFDAHRYRSERGTMLDGVRLRVQNPAAYRPITTAVTLLHVWQQLYGPEHLFDHPDTRARHFDELMGTREAQRLLRTGCYPLEIADAWADGCRAFLTGRAPHILY